MKIFKQIDLTISATLLAVLLGSLIGNYIFLITIIYSVIACWLLVSIGVHILMKWLDHLGGYRVTMHYFFVGCMVLIVLVDLAAPVVSFIVPLYAGCYTFLCYSEVKSIRFRELIHLKK